MKKNSDRLKILFLPHWYPDSRNPVSGIFIMEHAKAVSLFNEVAVIYSEGCDVNLKTLWKTTSDKTENGIRTIRIKHKKIPNLKSGYPAYLWSLSNALKKLLEEGWRPDIIHAHVYPSGIPALVLGRINRIPVIITEHWSVFTNRELNKFEALKARFAMNKADIILPVSQNLENAIKSYGVKNRFKVVPNAVNTGVFFPAVKKQKTGIKQVLFAGLISPVKGLPGLLRSIAIVKRKRRDFVLNIIGDGPDKKKCEELAKSLLIRELVHFHGLKQKEEIAEFMRSSVFLVSSSIYETFGVVLVEAIASGLPVLSTNKGGPAEIVSKDIGILVPPANINSMAEAFDYMLDHYLDYPACNLHKVAADKFSYDKVGRELDLIYKKILYGKNPGDNRLRGGGGNG